MAEPTPKKPAKAGAKTGAKKGPRRKAASGQKTLRVKQVRSGIGHAETYRRTLRSLGLRHHHQEIVLHDSPSVRGMLHKVQHLVRVSEEA